MTPEFREPRRRRVQKSRETTLSGRGAETAKFDAAIVANLKERVHGG